MGCSNPNIPSYLHQNNRKILKPWRFVFWHLIYRTGHRENPNPIEADKMKTGYSVCWSKLIRHSDVLTAVLAANAKLGDSVYFGKIIDFKKVVVTSECEEGVFKGKHTVKTKVHHKPIACNYSHSEVILEHAYFENDVKKIKVLQYDDWQGSLFVVGKPPLFYKKLKADYRAKVFTVLNNELNHINLPRYIKYHPKRILIKLLLFLKLR